MSRSALWRQEANLKERERQALETFQQVVEEGKSKHGKGIIPLVGPSNTFNLNPMLIHNISKSSYFLKCCSKISEWSALVDEVYYEVKHMEPWATGHQPNVRDKFGSGSKSPSTAFCLLVRLFTLRCTEKQMSSMLAHPDSPYIRCTGFLYLRYAAEPSLVWGWFEPFLYDDEPVRVSSDPKQKESTVGQYARDLLCEMNYHGTVLPRLPVAIERDIKVKMLLAEKIEERAVRHLEATGGNRPAVEYFEEGVRVRALYGDDENPVTWYDAIIDRVIRRDEETGEQLVRPKYWVTFPEYGNSECVSLGEVDLSPIGHGRREPDRYDGAIYERGRERGRFGRNHYSSYESNSPGKDYASRRSSSVVSGGRRRGYRDTYESRRRTDDYPRSSQGRERDHDRDRDRNHNNVHREDTSRKRRRGRSRSRSCSRDSGKKDGLAASSTKRNQEDNLMEEVLRREREKCAAKGKAYAQRPATFKRSLADRIGGSSNARSRSRSPDLRRHALNVKPETEVTESSSKGAIKREKTVAERAAVEDKKRKLLERYG